MGMGMGFQDDRGKRDEERDRERARNGVRGLRSGNMGQRSAFGGPTLIPPAARLVPPAVAHPPCPPRPIRLPAASQGSRRPYATQSAA